VKKMKINPDKLLNMAQKSVHGEAYKVVTTEQAQHFLHRTPPNILPQRNSKSTIPKRTHRNTQGIRKSLQYPKPLTFFSED